MEGKGRFERNLRQFRGIKIRRPGFRLAAAVLLTVLSMDVACGLLPLKGVDIRPGSSGGGQRSVNQVGEAPSGTTRSVQKWSKVPHKLWAQPSVVPVRFGQICGWIVDVKTKVGTKLSATHDKVASHVARQEQERTSASCRSKGGAAEAHSHKQAQAQQQDAATAASKEGGDVEDLKWSDVTPWKLIVADSMATVVERSLLFPIDTLRTRMQVDSTAGINLRRQLVDVTASTWIEGWNVGLRRGRKHALEGGVIGVTGALMVAMEGVGGAARRFYSGLSFSVVNQVPSNVLYLCTYQRIKELVEIKLPHLGRTEEGSPWPPLIASTITEVLCTPFDVPHDVITQRFQTLHSDALAPFTRTWRNPVRGLAEMKRIFVADGMSGLYASTQAHLLTYLPWSATWWCCYEVTKIGLGRALKPMNITGGPVHIAAGTLAGFAAAAISNPIDILKTRMQCDASLRGKSILTVARDIVSKEGPQALFKGLAMAILFDSIVSAGGGYRYNFVMSFAAKRPQSEAKAEQEGGKRERPTARGGCRGECEGASSSDSVGKCFGVPSAQMPCRDQVLVSGR